MRFVNFCEICGQLDDHPKHVRQLRADSDEGVPSQELLDKINAPDNVPIAAIETLYAGNAQRHHMDCGAANGCEICIDTESVNGGLRGQALIDHLTGGSNG